MAAVPRVELSQITCFKCGSNPTILVYPVLVEERGGNNVIRGNCSGCNLVINFLSKRIYPKSYDLEKKVYYLEFAGMKIEFKSKRARNAVKHLVEQSSSTLEKLSAIYKKELTVEEFSALLDRKDLKGAYFVKKNKFIMRVAK